QAMSQLFKQHTIGIPEVPAINCQYKYFLTISRNADTGTGLHRIIRVNEHRSIAHQCYATTDGFFDNTGRRNVGVFVSGSHERVSVMTNRKKASIPAIERGP